MSTNLLCTPSPFLEFAVWATINLWQSDHVVRTSHTTLVAHPGAWRSRDSTFKVFHGRLAVQWLKSDQSFVLLISEVDNNCILLDESTYDVTYQVVNYGSRSFLVAGLEVCNCLPKDITTTLSRYLP